MVLCTVFSSGLMVMIPFSQAHGPILKRENAPLNQCCGAGAARSRSKKSYAAPAPVTTATAPDLTLLLNMGK
jgi:hypothetical protein